MAQNDYIIIIHPGIHNATNEVNFAANDVCEAYTVKYSKQVTFIF